MITRLITIITCCFFLFSTQRAQAQAQGYIFPVPIGTTTSYVTTNYLAGSSGYIMDHSLMFGLFLVQFDGLKFTGKESCEEVEEMLRNACPNCPKPSTSAPTKIQGGGINYVTFDPTILSKGQSNVISFMNTWGNTLNADFTGGCTVTTAFLDSGIDEEHLNSNTTGWFSNTLAQATADFSNPYDNNAEGHGTHTIGVTAQIVSHSNIKLLSIKTQNEIGEGTVWSAIKGIERAINNKTSILNMSLAYFPKCVGTDEQPMATAMRIAGEKYNVLFVTAAGNDKENLNDCPGYSIYPSMFNLPNQINVGALNDDHSLVDSPEWGTNRGNMYVHIGALGVGVNSTVLYGDVDIRNGTSAAAPQVTTVASIIASMSCGKKTYAEIRNCILGAAIPHDLPFSTGGYLDPDYAIKCYRQNDGNYNDWEIYGKPKSEYAVYPNPFDEILHIQYNTNDDSELTKCVLFSSMGKEIRGMEYKGNINETWEVNDLPKGLYLLKIQHEDTQEIQKLIKQ